MTEEKETHKKNRIIANENACSCVVAFCGCIGCIGIIANENMISYTNSFLSVIIFGLGLYLIRNIIPSFKEASKREKIYAYSFSLILSLALHMGSRLELYDAVNFKSAWLYIGSFCLSIFLAPIIDKLWKSIFSASKKDVKKNDENPLKFTSVWLIIFLLWIPTFLAFFPGAFVYDAADEYLEVIMRYFSMHHPLFHVLLLGGIVHAGEYLGLGANAGIAVYTILQMLAMSWIFAYAIKALQGFGARKKYLLGVIVVIGVFPLFPMYAVCSAKDTLFTGIYLLMIIILLQFIYEQDKFFKTRMVLFVATSVLMMLFRNNGAYAYIVAIPFTALMLVGGIEKKNWMKLVMLMLLSVVIFKGSEYCLKTFTHASDNEHQEILTVPIQQLANVYLNSPDSYTSEEIDVLHELLSEDYLNRYEPRCSDVIKYGFDNDKYASNPGKYQKLWLDIGKKEPLMYINAWLVNSYGYWYPDMIINVYQGNEKYTFTYVDSSYFGFETEPPGERKSLFPLLERFYRNISLELFQQKVPVLSMLFSPGFMFWIFLFVFVGFMRQRSWQEVAVYMPVLLVFGTVLLGPTILVRYVLILWFVAMTYPVCIKKLNERN